MRRPGAASVASIREHGIRPNQRFQVASPDHRNKGGLGNTGETTSRRSERSGRTQELPRKARTVWSMDTYFGLDNHTANHSIQYVLVQWGSRSLIAWAKQSVRLREFWDSPERSHSKIQILHPPRPGRAIERAHREPRATAFYGRALLVAAYGKLRVESALIIILQSLLALLV